MKETLKYVLMDASIEFDLFVIGRNALVYMFERVSWSPIFTFVVLYLFCNPFVSSASAEMEPHAEDDE